MAANRRIRVMIVDDSAVMRSLLRSVVHSDPALEVAGTAADGASALSLIESIRPDLVLLDVCGRASIPLQGQERLVPCEHLLLCCMAVLH